MATEKQDQKRKPDPARFVYNVGDIVVIKKENAKPEQAK